MLELNAQHLLDVLNGKASIDANSGSKTDPEAGRRTANNLTSGTSISVSQGPLPEVAIFERIPQLAWFRHDAGHVNMAFIEYDGNTFTRKADSIEISNLLLAKFCFCNHYNLLCRRLNEQLLLPSCEVAMPGSIGGSYQSLTGSNDVYRSTTVAGSNAGVMDTVKKALSLGSTKEQRKPVIIPARIDSAAANGNEKMPASGAAEEAALLGTMPSDSMDDIELKNIQLQFPSTRSLSRDDSTAHEETVETDRGPIVVAVQGSRNKPAILTYHDLGLNYISSFQAFFNYVDMRALLENFCVYHVNAPGQEEGAQTLPEDYIFPTMDELATQLEFVLSHFGLKQVIGFGVGAGANILSRYALTQPNKVAALCLINCLSTPAGWIEWGYQKINARHLRSKGMTQGVLDYLMWHHFGRNTEERNHDLVQVYKSYFERNVNPTNLALFIDSYVRRTDLNIQRELDPNKRKEANTLHMPVLNITGAGSPHVDDTITLNGRLDPTNSSWMKISDCGMVLEEQPGKVSEAFRLFLQGEGYAIQVGRRRASSAASIEVAPLSPVKMAQYRKASLEEMLKSKLEPKLQNGQWPSSVIHITENPISAVVC